MENSNDTVKVVSALIIGTLVGAALGVLFAPYKGSKTRSKLVGGAKDLADDLTKKIKDEVKALRYKAEELEGLAEGNIHEAVNGAKQKIDTLKHQA